MIVERFNIEVYRYKFFCMADIPVKRIVSDFGGSDFSTSIFRRRSINGLSSLCSWPIILCFASVSSTSRLNQSSNYCENTQICRGFNGDRKVSGYLLGRSEDVRQKEIKQRPQLVKVVLQRSAGQKQTVLSVQKPNCLRELRNREGKMQYLYTTSNRNDQETISSLEKPRSSAGAPHQ